MNVLMASTTLSFAFADMRGFMTAHGQPDQPRSARYILKDYVNVSHRGLFSVFCSFLHIYLVQSMILDLAH